MGECDYMGKCLVVVGDACVHTATQHTTATHCVDVYINVYIYI